MVGIVIKVKGPMSFSEAVLCPFGGITAIWIEVVQCPLALL